MSSGVRELLWPSKASCSGLLSVPPMSPVQCLASGLLHMQEPLGLLKIDEIIEFLGQFTIPL